MGRGFLVLIVGVWLFALDMSNLHFGLTWQLVIWDTHELPVQGVEP